MKKISLVAILLSVSLFFSCSNSSANGTKGGFSFQLDEATITAFTNQAKKAASVKTVARTADGDITADVTDAVYPDDSDFANQIAQAGINLVITDKKGKEVAGCYEPWTEASQNKVFTFEDLNLYQPYTVSAYFKAGNTSFYYGSGKIELKNPEETETVALALKPNDVISSPLVTVKGTFDKEQTEKSTKCFGVIAEPVYAANEEDAAKFSAASFLQIGYVDSYPATITLAFGSNCTVQLFDANGKAMEAEVKADGDGKAVDFVLNDAFSTNYMIVTAEDSSTGLFASTYVAVVKDYAAVNPLKTDYIIFNKMDPKGIWLVDEIPAADDNTYSEKTPYAGSNSGQFNSYMSFDADGGLWYVGQNNGLYRNGVDVGWNTLRPTLKAYTMSYDIMEDYLYLYVIDTSTNKRLLVKLDVKEKESESFNLTEDCIIGISETSIYDILPTDSIYRFCADSGKIFIADAYGVVFMLDDYKAAEFTSSFNLEKELNAGGLWISDLIVKDNVLYVLASQCWKEGMGTKIYQRGGVVSIVYDDGTLKFNTDFNKTGVYGWTADDAGTAIDGGIFKGTLVGPNDPESADLFGQSTFVGIQPGKLVFSDVGCYFATKEDGSLTTADVKRIMILNLSDMTVKPYQTSPTFALDDSTVQGQQSLYGWMKSLRRY